MGTTFQSLLNELIKVRHASYRNTADMERARRDTMEYVVQRMLEMLRDQFDPR